MSKFANDDLFEGSKMTFGEHLEELRVALWRAVLGLAIGVAIGFLIGDKVVIFIQTPLVAAMEEYLLNRSLEDLAKRYQAEGIEVQNKLENGLPPDLDRFVRLHHVQPKLLYVHRDDLTRIGKWEQAREGKPYVAPIGETPVPTPTPDARPTPDAKPGTTTPETVKRDPDPMGSVNVAPQAEDLTQPVSPQTPDFIQMYIWEPIKVKVSAMNASEAFMIYVQAAIVSGLVFSSPWVIYQIWVFIAEGLYPHERGYVYVFLPISLTLFLAGAALAFFFVFQPVLSFLFTYNKALQVDPDPRISEWIGFVLMLPLGFGMAFQLPLVMLFIERIGVVSASTYLSQWRIAILVIFVLSAVLTPADPISMLMMAVPLVGLYFGGIGLCLWLPIGRKPFDEAYEP